MPPVRIAERDMLSVPSKNPKVGPIAREAMMRANHIGSIPIAPIPSGRSEAISAVKIPRSAIFFDPSSSLVMRTMTSRRVRGDAARKNQLAFSANSFVGTKNGQRKPREERVMSARSKPVRALLMNLAQVLVPPRHHLQ